MSASQNDNVQLQQLLHVEDFGDRQPSQLLRICRSLAEIQSEMLLMMRFFASFSCRNFHSPFAALLPCTKMSASVSSPRTLHTTWRKSRVLKQSINSSTRVILKLGQLKPSYRGSGKRCRCLHQCMNSHSLAPSLTFVGTTNDSA